MLGGEKVRGEGGWEVRLRQAREEDSEAGMDGHRGAGIGAPGAHYLGENVDVRALGQVTDLFLSL